ncbi:MAG TPA: acetolactate synthase [Candidatus Nitrosotalea sp.]|nr:acetolactate synthase [Candidatus Nitrosotalea sp.]
MQAAGSDQQPLMAVGTLLARSLREAGAGPIFTLNGAHIWGIYLGATELDLNLLDTRDERSAAFAALGWSKLTRRLGVAAVTAGPGVTNAISALASARSEDAPMLLLAGRAPISRWGMGSLQELDQVTLVSSLVKYAATVFEPDRTQGLVREAIESAFAARTGPAFIDVPIDVFLGVGRLDEPGGTAAQPPGPPDPGQVALAARLLRGATHPVIVAGSGVWWAHAEQEVVELAEASGAPLVLNGMARGMVPPDHHLFASRGRSFCLASADVVVLAGVPLDFRLNWGLPPVLSEDVQLIYIDGDELRHHRPPSAALIGDVRASLAALAEVSGRSSATAPWIQLVEQARSQVVAADADLAACDSSPVHPARLVAEAERALDPDAIVVVDGGDFGSFAGRMIHRRGPGLWLDGGPFGCLGAGLGQALAAKLAHPQRQVLLLSGDGAFGFSAMEFDTLIRHRVNVVCVIANNGIWATEKHAMEDFLGTSLLADLRPQTRYDLMVAALGGHAELVSRPQEIRPALERAFASGLPALVNVMCDPEARYPRSTVLL